MGWDFQERVGRHVAEVTQGDPTDIPERRDRFGEESLEVQQAFGQTRAEAHALVDYVHGRPKGEPRAEIGGALYTIAALAREAGLDAAACGEAELARISTPGMVAKIRAKRATRHGRGPLPGIGMAEPAAGDLRSPFAAGALARAAGADRASCPHDAQPSRAAWAAGWQACDSLPATAPDVDSQPGSRQEAAPRFGAGMRQEARIGCAIMMLGTALGTLSSMTGLGMTGQAGLKATLVLGALVLAMVAGAGSVLVEGSPRASLAASAAGILGSLAGYAMVGHVFTWAFPGIYAGFALLSLAFARQPRTA